ncbi:MAG: DUF115 domain-containing protein [Termitinemataceae bacterium]|nr:MAG: DUF115 domain-containing protein [Termitinemataceae bacterium]
MNDLFNSNISVMQDIFPNLAAQLSADMSGCKNIEVRETAVGSPTLIVDGITIHSQRDPLKEAERLVQSALNDSIDKNSKNDKTDDAIIFLGLGLAYSVIASEKLLGENKKNIFIIVEKNIDILKIALQTVDITNVLSKRPVIFMIGGKSEGIIAALSAVKKVRTVIKNISLINLDKEWYNGIEKNIQTWMAKESINNAGLIRFGKRWIKNTASNLSMFYSTPGVTALQGKFNFPVLLLAAGPSLDDIAPYLEDLKKRFVIVAVDTALRFLKNNNVCADFVITVDPQYWNCRHLDRVLTEQSVLIAESAVYPQTLRLRKASGVASLFLFSTVFPLWKYFEDRIEKKGRLAAGGSVATSALDFAMSLNPTARTITAGLDLSFPDFKTHYKGALFEEKAISCANRLSPAQTKSFLSLRSAAPFYAKSANGGNVLTDKRMSLYAAWFENKIAEYQNHNTASVYDLTGKGLFIQGMQQITIDKVLKLSNIRSKIEKQKEKIFFEIKECCANDQKKQKEKFTRSLNTLKKELYELKISPEKKNSATEIIFFRLGKETDKQKIAAEADFILECLAKDA